MNHALKQAIYVCTLVGQREIDREKSIEHETDELGRIRYRR